MKSAAIASLFLAGAALAAPVAERRDVKTDVVVTTIWTTTTLYVDGPTGGAFFEKARRTSSSSSASSTSSVSSSSSSSVTPVPSVPAPVVAPSAPASSEAPVAAPSAAPVAAAPSAAPVAAAPSAAPVAAAAAAPASGSGPSGTGDVTYYTVNGVPGSCGTQKSDSDAVVALSHLTMNNGANSNNNPLCGKTINIQGETQVVQAVVYDTCEGCSAESIDLSPSLFKTAFPNGDGRVHNIKWWVS